MIKGKVIYQIRCLIMLIFLNLWVESFAFSLSDSLWSYPRNIIYNKINDSSNKIDSSCRFIPQFNNFHYSNHTNQLTETEAKEDSILKTKVSKKMTDKLLRQINKKAIDQDTLIIVIMNSFKYLSSSVKKKDKIIERIAVYSIEKDSIIPLFQQAYKWKRVLFFTNKFQKIAFKNETNFVLSSNFINHAVTNDIKCDTKQYKNKFFGSINGNLSIVVFNSKCNELHVSKNQIFHVN
jgi:hypothetical protein